REPRSRLVDQIRSAWAPWRRPWRALAAPANLVRILLAAGTVVLVCRVYDRAMFERPDGIYTGVDHNFGDLPFHVGVICGFTEGQNLPPEHPELAGARLTYPFLVDFLSAMLVRAGIGLRASVWAP